MSLLNYNLQSIGVPEPALAGGLLLAALLRSFFNKFDLGNANFQYPILPLTGLQNS